MHCGQWWQSLHRTLLHSVLGKTFQLIGYTGQYGCIAHYAFEDTGDVVMCSDHHRSLQFQVQILSLQKILAGIFMASKEVTL